MPNDSSQSRISQLSVAEILVVVAAGGEGCPGIVEMDQPETPKQTARFQIGRQVLKTFRGVQRNP
jgi:hypothetical protein